MLFRKSALHVKENSILQKYLLTQFASEKRTTDYMAELIFQPWGLNNKIFSLSPVHL